MAFSPGGISGKIWALLADKTTDFGGYRVLRGLDGSNFNVR